MALMMKTRGQLGTPEKKPGTEELEAIAAAQAAAEAEPVEQRTETEAEAVEEDAEEPKGLRGWRARRKEQKQLAGQFDSYPHLLALKPNERYRFRSDYFEVDGSVATVLAFFHDDAARELFAAFWGIDRIPDGLDDSVTAVVLEQVVRRDDKWIDSYTKQSERLDNLEAQEQDEAGTTSSRRKAAKVASDLEATISEIQDGASYLSVHNRLLLKAPDLETLEESIERITRLYIDRFGTLKIAPYPGEQRQELSALFKNNDKKRGKGFHFTSTELAGSYSLVTNGLNDRGGEYVGYMVGDVNQAAVLMDVNAYEDRVVIADATVSTYLDRQRVSNMWCSKLSQATLLNNGQVVHLVLDGADLDRLGPAFERLTARVDLNQGDVNMFEMFGEQDEELAVFSAQMEKLKLMVEQMYEATDGSVASIIRGALEDVATDFYVEQGMWRHNAKEQRHRLRVVGIPHEQVPRLQMFSSYIATARKALINSGKVDQDQLRAYNVLRSIVQTMLSTNGDLFNNHTASAIDGVRDSRRVVYDFSRLMRRGKGVAMAQLVNIIGFAVGKLGLGDTVIIHGTEKIDSRVKAYITDQFGRMQERGGRVVFSYNDVDKMLADSEFNLFDAADYTVFGAMRDKTVEEYQKQLGQQIPPDLARLITRKGENLTYLRRGVSNVVFHTDLALGINPYREAQRRKVRLEATKAEESARMDQLMKEKPEPGAKLTSLSQSVEQEAAERAESEGGSARAGEKKAPLRKKSLDGNRGQAREDVRGRAPRKLTKK